MSKLKSTGALKRGSAGILAACVFVACAFFCRVSAGGKADDLQKDSGLKIYLPREVMVQDSSLNLGQLSIIRGRESLVAEASKISMGRIAVPGQTIVIDRLLVLSRLACSGIPASKVTLSGAEKITIRQRYKVVTGDEFVALAVSLLENIPPGSSGCRWNPMRKPEDFVVPGAGQDIRFSPRLDQSGVRNQVKVNVAILSAGKEIGVREVVFALKYSYRHAVTKIDVAAGGVFSPENLRIETQLSDYPEPADWAPPYGLAARRRLPADTVLLSHMVEAAKSPVIIERNQNVVIRIERPGFLITAVGKTMQDGKAGELIKVRNVDSQRIILVKIREDGCVEPVL